MKRPGFACKHFALTPPPPFLSPAACKLFGYSRIQLERRSAFTLMPEPIARLHEDSLRQYNQSGEAAIGVVDYTRIMLVLTKDGTITPVISSFKDAPVDEGSSYIWALRELRTDANYIIADSDGVLTAIDAATASVWGIDVNLLESRSLHISFFIPDWLERLPELQSASGAVVGVERKDAAGERGEGESADDNGSDDERSPVESISVPTNAGKRKYPPIGNATNNESLVILLRVQIIDIDKNMVLHWKRMSPSDLAIHGMAQSTSKLRQRQTSVVAIKANLVAAPGLPLASVTMPPPMQSALAGVGSGIHRTSVNFAEMETAEFEGINSDDDLVNGLFDGDAFNADAPVPKRHPSLPMDRPAPSHALALSPPIIAPSPADLGNSLLCKEAPLTQPSSVVKRATQSERTYDAPASEKGHGNGHSVVSDSKSKASSSKSSVGVHRSMTRLRKVLSAENPPMIASLSWLRFAGILLTVMAIGLAVVLATVTRENFTTIDEYIVYAGMASERIHAKSSAILSAQELLYHGRGWSNLSDTDLATYREYILTNVSKFVELHLEMRSMRRDPSTSWAWTTRECARRCLLHSL